MFLLDNFGELRRYHTLRLEYLSKQFLSFSHKDLLCNVKDLVLLYNTSHHCIYHQKELDNIFHNKYFHYKFELLDSETEKEKTLKRQKSMLRVFLNGS